MNALLRLKNRIDTAPVWTLAAVLFAGLTAWNVADLLARVPAGDISDEWRYRYYAENLLKGFFSPQPRVFLWNGPGYPLVLAPFVKFGWVTGARLLNGALHAGAVAYGWCFLRRSVAALPALGAALVLALYGPGRNELPLIMTEPLCLFLAAAFLFHASASPGRAQTLLAGILLGALCLTKLVFGAACMALWPLLVLARLRTRAWQHALVVTTIALAMCAPWLAYTYQLTGRPLYWSRAGPNSFYWLTSPYPDEWGDWYHDGWVHSNATLRAHHLELFERTAGLTADPTVSHLDQLFNLSTPESSDEFQRAAMRNVREHPVKFVKNWLANLVRMFLDVPVSVRGTPLLNPFSAWHAPLLVWLSAVAVILLRRRSPLPPRLATVGLVLLATLAVYSLSSAVARFVVPLFPLLWLGSISWLSQRPVTT